jgi:hypothetical protein
MLLDDVCDIFHVSEEKVLDVVRHVQCLYHVLDPQSRIKVLVRVAADVEVPRDFLYRKSTGQMAAVSVLEGCFCHLVLSLLVWFVEQLEWLSSIEGNAVAVYAYLID